MFDLCTPSRPQLSESLIEWSDDRYGVGVHAMDVQHRVLVRLLNQAHLTINDEPESSTLLVVLEELQHFSVVHFRTEEELMARHGYPLGASHAADHKHLRMRTDQLLESCVQGQLGAGRETLHFLRDWFSTHLLKLDRDLGRYLNSVGIS